MLLGERPGDFLRAEFGKACFPTPDLRIQRVKRFDRGRDDGLVNAALVAGEPGLVDVEVAVVGEHKHP
jgi:hypothetical protein